MNNIPNEPKKCIVCSLVLIPGDNINENEHKRGLKTCRSCKRKAIKEKRDKINELCATSEQARWKRVETVARDCCNRTRTGEEKLPCDLPDVLIKHLREKYPVLPVVCPIYEEIDLIYSSMSLTDPRRNNGISIDRINASKGYIVDNVQIVSHYANRKKTDSSLKDVLKIAAHGFGSDKKQNNKIIKDNGFVFFLKNNREKKNKKEKILEKQGGVSSGLVNDGQFEFGFVHEFI